MGYHDSGRIPKVDESVYVLENGKPNAPWLLGKIVGISHDDQEVLVKTDDVLPKHIKTYTTKLMFNSDPARPPEPGVD